MTTIPSNLIPTRITELPEYGGSDASGLISYVLGGRTYRAQLSNLLPAGSGTVTSVDVSGGTTGLSFSGGPVTSSGTLTAAGTLAVANGGTGATTAGTARLALLPDVTANAGKVLVVNAGATDVEWASKGTVTSIDASGGTTGLSFSGGPVTTSGTLTLAGTLAIANGGTGSTTAATARVALLPTVAANAGKVLAVNAGATDVEWISTGGTGTVTSVNASGGTTGLSFSGGPVTASGTLTLSGTLAVANGGTGQTSYTDGQLLIGNSAGNTLNKATLTAGSNVSIVNGAGSITISASAPAVSDGDKGDITVSSSGTVWTVDNSAITYAKIQNVSATDKVLGRSTAGAGVVEEITCTSAGRNLIAGASTSAQRTTLGLAIGSDVQAYSANLDAVTTSGALLQGVHTLYATYSDIVPRTTSGPAAGTTESGTNKVMLKTLDYDATTAEYAQVTIPMPKSWNEGTITVQFIWTALASGNVVWSAQALSVSDGDNVDTAFGTAQSVTDTISYGGTGNGTVQYSAFTSAITVSGSPAAEDVVILQIYRDAANGSDTLAADAKLIAVRVKYTLNAGNDS